jgi:hypothetical protein
MRRARAPVEPTEAIVRRDSVDDLPPEVPYELSDAERTRIRAEVRYAMVAANEARPPSPSRSPVDRVLGYFSNGFVLLIIGSLITSGLVPYFQRAYESRAQRAALMRECFSQFLLYSNSIWQEYYAVLPLTQETDLSKDDYLKYLARMAEIKLKRYEAYAKVQALALAFRDTGSAAASDVETALHRYAVVLNAASADIDRWLTGLYCTPTTRAASPCASFDARFDAFDEHLKIKGRVIDIGNAQTDDVAGLMVKAMTRP